MILACVVPPNIVPIKFLHSQLGHADCPGKGPNLTKWRILGAVVQLENYIMPLMEVFLAINLSASSG